MNEIVYSKYLKSTEEMNGNPFMLIFNKLSNNNNVLMINQLGFNIGSEPKKNDNKKNIEH